MSNKTLSPLDRAMSFLLSPEGKKQREEKEKKSLSIVAGRSYKAPRSATWVPPKAPPTINPPRKGPDHFEAPFLQRMEERLRLIQEENQILENLLAAQIFSEEEHTNE